MTLIQNAITFGVPNLSVTNLTKVSINILRNVTEKADLRGKVSELYLGEDLFESRTGQRSI